MSSAHNHSKRSHRSEAKHRSAAGSLRRTRLRSKSNRLMFGSLNPLRSLTKLFHMRPRRDGGSTEKK